MKKIKHLFAIFTILCCVSCTQHETVLKEGDIEFIGILGDLPDHSEKANGIGITIQGEAILFKGNYKIPSKEVFGKRIRVTGILEKQNLPMFIWELHSSAKCNFM